MITDQQREEINENCINLGITSYTIQDDGSVDVDGDVKIYRRKLKQIPVQFGIVSGRFDCMGNKLKSLKGCPRFVGETFDCAENKLNSLVGGPEVVVWNYSCDDNELDTFMGLPKKIGNELLCEHNFVDDEIIDYIQNKMDNEYLNKFLRFYKDYEVFTEDSYSLENFRMLIEDIDDGLE